MSSPAGGPDAAVGPVSGPAYDDQLLLRNDGDAPTRLNVVQRTGDAVTSETIEADPHTTYGLSMSAAAGTTLVEVHTRASTATISVGPDERPPLFRYRDGAVLVDRG